MFIKRRAFEGSPSNWSPYGENLRTKDPAFRKHPNGLKLQNLAKLSGRSTAEVIAVLKGVLTLGRIE